MKIEGGYSYYTPKKNEDLLHELDDDGYDYGYRNNGGYNYTKDGNSYKPSRFSKYIDEYEYISEIKFGMKINKDNTVSKIEKESENNIIKNDHRKIFLI